MSKSRSAGMWPTGHKLDMLDVKAIHTFLRNRQSGWVSNQEQPAGTFLTVQMVGSEFKVELSVQYF